MPLLIEDLVVLIERGGFVMIPLLVMSVISLTLIFERIVFWISTHSRASVRRLKLLNDALRRGERAKAEGILGDDRSPFAQVARYMLKSGASDAVALEAVESQRPRLDRFMVSLSTIVTAAPLLGILGTVFGIIQSFQLLGEQTQLTDPRDVSAGIAAALLTTALGLIVALITLFPYMVFRSNVERALGRLESVIAAAQQGYEEGSSLKVRTESEVAAVVHRMTPSPESRTPEPSTASVTRERSQGV